MCLDSLLETKQIQTLQRSSSFKENSASTSIPRGTSVVKPYRPPEERKQSKNNSRSFHVYVNLSTVCLLLSLKYVYFLNSLIKNI